MPSKRTLLGAAAFSLALAGGGAAGAVLGTPTASSAQDGATTTTEAPDDAATPVEGAHPHRGGHRGEGLDTAAEVLGLTPEELRSELEGGKSIAQVAEERDVDVQDVVDALVAKGTERLEAAIAALPERITELVEREGLPRRGGPGHGRGDHGHGPGAHPGEEAPGGEDAEDDDAES